MNDIMQTNIQNFINLINQLIIHLNRIPESEYGKKLQTLGNSSIGEHVRHIYNFPECLLRGIQTGVVNYDKRIRNTQIETNREYAIKCLLEQTGYIINLDHYSNKPLVLEVEAKENSPRIDTNLTRELHYIIEHTIHHMAILRIGMNFHFPSLEIEGSFGFAYSTLEYKNLTSQT